MIILLFSGIWTGGPLVLEHSTVSNNSGDGSAIHGYDITLRNSTVRNNTGNGPAAGISYGSSATVRLFNSPVAFNSPAPSIGMVPSQGGMVRGTGSVGITCSTTAQSWSAAVAALTGGVFATGQALAAARTSNTPVWVTPATTSRTIKLVRPPRR